MVILQVFYYSFVIYLCDSSPIFVSAPSGMESKRSIGLLANKESFPVYPFQSQHGIVFFVTSPFVPVRTLVLLKGFTIDEGDHCCWTLYNLDFRTGRPHLAHPFYSVFYYA